MNEHEKSSIGEMMNGEYHLRGKGMRELIERGGVVAVMWYVWMGQMPSAGTEKVLEACFIACLDHGAEPPSAHVTRVAASCGKPLAEAVAAGLLTLGPRHGNAASHAATWIREAVASRRSAEDVVMKTLEEHHRLPGAGHPVYDIDPRTSALYTVATKHLPATPHFEFALEVSRILSKKRGKPVPLNVDGALGAIISDLDAPAELADAIFLVARSAGLVAHAREARASKSYYR